MFIIFACTTISLLSQPLYKSSIEHLQGSWKVVVAKDGDESLMPLFEGVTYEIKGAKATIFRGKSIESVFVISKLNLRGEIEYTTSVAGDKNSTIQQIGIYRISRDKITLCLARSTQLINKDGTSVVTLAPRPTRFNPSDGPFLVLERIR